MDEFIEKDKDQCWVERYRKNNKYKVLCIPLAGNYAPLKIGLFKAQAIMQHIPAIEQFIDMLREERDFELKEKDEIFSTKKKFKQEDLDLGGSHLDDCPQEPDHNRSESLRTMDEAADRASEEVEIDEDVKNKIMRLTKTQCEYNDSFQKGWRENLKKDGWMLIVISDKEE